MLWLSDELLAALLQSLAALNLVVSHARGIVCSRTCVQAAAAAAAPI